MYLLLWYSNGVARRGLHNNGIIQLVKNRVKLKAPGLSGALLFIGMF
jgi:hypothetical protein